LIPRKKNGRSRFKPFRFVQKERKGAKVIEVAGYQVTGAVVCV
jgi:hypothetical protein